MRFPPLTSPPQPAGVPGAAVAIPSGNNGRGNSRSELTGASLSREPGRPNEVSTGRAPPVSHIAKSRTLALASPPGGVAPAVDYLVTLRTNCRTATRWLPSLCCSAGIAAARRFERLPARRFPANSGPLAQRSIRRDSANAGRLPPWTKRDRLVRRRPGRQRDDRSSSLTTARRQSADDYCFSGFSCLLRGAVKRCEA
jgi:hypothetical protein